MKYGVDADFYFIAEAGVNHNGSCELAVRLVEAAHEAGANAVKFQTFKANLLVTGSAPKANYQIRATGSDEGQRSMLTRLELSPEAHDAIVATCDRLGIDFLSTPFDVDSLDLLTSKYGMKTIKVPSGEITNGPFLLEVARRANRVVLSTGMCSLGEVETALGVLAFGFTGCGSPSLRAFKDAFASSAGAAALEERVTLLHCTSEYPAPFEDVNLRAMLTMKAAFGLRVGYSDHTDGEHVSIAAVALGATIVEKHFTLDRTFPGPDHAASLEPAELGGLIAHLRDVRQALGDGRKRLMPSEADTAVVARKSLVAAQDLPCGHLLKEGDVVCKRPGSGRSPMEYWNTIGSCTARAYREDEVL